MPRFSPFSRWPCGTLQCPSLSLNCTSSSYVLFHCWAVGFHTTPRASSASSFLAPSAPVFLSRRCLVNHDPRFFPSSRCASGTLQLPVLFWYAHKSACMPSHCRPRTSHTMPADSSCSIRSVSRSPFFLLWRCVFNHIPSCSPPSWCTNGTLQSPSRSLYRNRSACMDPHCRPKRSQTTPSSVSLFSRAGSSVPFFLLSRCRVNQCPRLLLLLLVSFPPSFCWC
mmetsp:Transcript_18786/g.39514  ORF Transcript_18786/g.39514 Transcript_18786/m.39514 type:complete len:224 (-) Transcript_18786:265-936(-)